MMNISNRVGSSAYRAIADDSLKDEDNGFWLRGVAPEARNVWLQRFSWLRWVDRLAEQEHVVDCQGCQFSGFYHNWKQLFNTHHLPSSTSYPILQEIDLAWFQLPMAAQAQAEITAWDRYVDAIAAYHAPTLRLNTLADYEQMLLHLAGSCFQFLPDLPPHYRDIAGYLGMVDQFYNNLRDLYEDAQQGICYFPESVLRRFHLTREDILTQRCFEQGGYRPMMQFWVDQYLPRLCRQTLPLLLATDLPPAWQCLISWFVHRYVRIESTFKACHDNFVTFSQVYHQAVAQDLEHYSCLASEQFRAQLQVQYDTAELPTFLKMGPAAIAALRQNHQWGTAVSVEWGSSATRTAPQCQGWQRPLNEVAFGWGGGCEYSPALPHSFK